MDNAVVDQITQRWREGSRSLGVKLLVVCGLALIMSIPALLVAALVGERSRLAEQVISEVSAVAGGQQMFLGPTLAVPYRATARKAGEADETGTFYLFPDQGSADVTITTEERKRSLFRVPVFQADVRMEAEFDLGGAAATTPHGAALDWSRAEIVVGASDPRGARAEATLELAGKRLTMVPAALEAPFKIPLFTTSAAGVAQPTAKFTAKATLRFSGAQRLGVLAFGKTTRVRMRGDWPSPGFDGGFLPASRSVAKTGFQGEWSVPFIARGVPAEGRPDALKRLEATAMAVSLVAVADAYQSVNRALKYVLLFVGLIFLSYFVFEATSGRRVHPAQYLLVGLAQIIFYLLLLSLAERIGFDGGFAVAGSATVLLLALNTSWILRSRGQGVRALAIFGALYGLIYLLLRLEDNALLAGAFASFLAVATAMYLTRHLDWYGAMSGKTSDSGQ